MNNCEIFFNCVKSGLIDEVRQNYKPEYLELSFEFLKRPIHWACHFGHLSVAEFLIENHCDIEAVMKRGLRPIHLACEHGHLNLVNLLVKNDCNIESCSEDDYRPIHLACVNGHLDIVNFLIENRCDIEPPAKFDWRPIHFASANGHVEIVKLLFEKMCNIETFTDSDWRAIHLACKDGHEKVVTFLIQNNCNIDACTKLNKSPLVIAKENGNLNLIQIIKDEISRRLAVHVAVSMSLSCQTDCDHKLCLDSLPSNKFAKGELIGRGTFGKVFKIRESGTDREFAYKLMKVELNYDSKYVEQDINKYQKLMLHERIVQYFGAVEMSNKLYVFMEYVNGGSLKNQLVRLQKKSHDIVVQYTKQILEGVSFLHKNNIIHRDIKPENILLDQKDNIKLTDFGLSRLLESISKTGINKIEDASTFCGTPNYMAPEIIMGKRYSFPADIWSVGATVVAMLSGKPPYYAWPAEAIIFKIGNSKKLEFQLSKPISKEMKSLLSDMINSIPSKRSTADLLLKSKIFLIEK